MHGIAYTIVGLVAASIVISKLSASRKPGLDAIPTVGSSSRLGAWWAGFNFHTNAMETIQEGYDKYKYSVPFKVADLYQWIVFIGSRKHIDEIRMAENALSFRLAASDTVQMKYTMGHQYLRNSYHTAVLHTDFSRSLGELYPGIRDEVEASFEKGLDLEGSEWKVIDVLHCIHHVAARSANRAFVGLPLCQNPDWADINIRYTLDVFIGTYMIKTFPTFLAPYIVKFMTSIPSTRKRAVKLLTPIVEERLKLREEYGDDWPGRTNDLLSWLLVQAPEGSERTPEAWTTRLLITNFAAIHSAANSFYHSLFFLAENPQYIQPLREEVDSIVEDEGWSKASVAKMRKINSFLKECQRLVGSSAASVRRKAVQDFTFSDGTFIPKGTTIMVASRSLQMDDEHYENAREFNPFRFVDMFEEGNDTKSSLISTTSLDYVAFGIGKHTCAGRFFADIQLKTMLAHVVFTYDIKLEPGATSPKAIGIDLLPNPKARMMFRRRVR